METHSGKKKYTLGGCQLSRRIKGNFLKTTGRVQHSNSSLLSDMTSQNKHKINDSTNDHYTPQRLEVGATG